MNSTIADKFVTPLRKKRENRVLPFYKPDNHSWPQFSVSSNPAGMKRSAFSVLTPCFFSCTDSTLSELPFKIELNEWGKIEMSPASNFRGMLQAEIAFILRNKMPSGKSFVECSIQTSKNVKVADVVWCSKDFLKKHGKSTPYHVSPEIVIEVASPSNTLAELIEKRTLYFEQGAKEVCICEETGGMLFYRADGKLLNSVLCPGFPQSVDAYA